MSAHVRRHDMLMENMRIGLKLEARGLINLGSLVTHRYTLDHVDKAYIDLQSKPAGFMKAAISPEALA